jgi:hypothetical protein
MLRMNAAERRARLGLRHRLAGGAQAGDPVEAARSMVAVHSTDPSSVYLGLLARMDGGGIADVERALYTDRTLIRLLGMRRTVFVTTLDIAPVIQAACSDAVAANERRKLLGWLAESGGVGDDVDGWLTEVERVALDALTARGEVTAAELAAADPRLQVQIVLSRGKSYEGRQNISSRILLLLAAQGRVVRGRPRGSWTSHQYRWAPLTAWCPRGLDEWTAQAAEVELARRWLETFGPATADDLRWWTGWTKTTVQQVLSRLPIEEVDLHGQAGIALGAAAEDAGPDPTTHTRGDPPGPPAATLLPALDPTPMGWKHREWFFGIDQHQVFDRNGNIGPTLWWDGEIIGSWAVAATGEIRLKLVADRGTEASNAIGDAAARLHDRLHGAVITPAIRTPLERSLT